MTSTLHGILLPFLALHCRKAVFILSRVDPVHGLERQVAQNIYAASSLQRRCRKSAPLGLRVYRCRIVAPPQHATGKRCLQTTSEKAHIITNILVPCYYRAMFSDTSNNDVSQGSYYGLVLMPLGNCMSVTTSTPRLRPQIPSNRDLKAPNRGTSGGAGMVVATK